MSDGKKLVAALLEAGSVETLRLISDDLFLDEELTLFRFVRTHFRRYGELPSIRTVETETRQRLPNIDEPVAYYMKRLYDRQLFTALREGFSSLRDALTGNDVDAARLVVEGLRSACRILTPDNDLATLTEAGTRVMEVYQQAHLNPGLTGVPTGWHRIDSTTGGYQKGDLVTWVARMGVGKCMAPHTPVMLSDGKVVRIDSLRVGDTLMGPDSTPRTVLSTTTGREEMFRITPAHGEVWECNRSHILSLVCANTIDKLHVQGEKFLYSVDQYLSLPSRVRANLRLWRSALDFPEKPVLVAPRLVGLWLGDGSMGLAKFSTVDPEVVAYLHEQAEVFGFTVSQYEKREGFCPLYGLVDAKGRDNYLKEFFKRRCSKGGEKRIPQEYLHNSREVRMEMLAGLMDSDGHYVKHAKCYEICTKYAGLKDDIVYLARSLGFRVSYVRRATTHADSWRILITADDYIPCLLARKRQPEIDRRSRVDWSTFSVESLGDGEYFGITLDKDSLYLLGDCTVTHNTFLMLKQALHAWENGYSVLIVSMEMTIDQITRRILGLQSGINPDYIRKGTMCEFSTRRIQRYLENVAHADRLNVYAGSFSKKVGDLEVLIGELCPDIIFVDGAYLLHPDIALRGGSRLDRVPEVYDALKRMTITSDRPIVTTTQFSRQAGKRGKDGSLETISFSDAIAMHSSLVFGIKEGPPPFQETRRFLEIMKGREGEFGEFQINYGFTPVDFSEVLGDLVAAEAVNLDWMV